MALLFPAAPGNGKCADQDKRDLECASAAHRRTCLAGLNRVARWGLVGSTAHLSSCTRIERHCKPAIPRRYTSAWM